MKFTRIIIGSIIFLMMSGAYSAEKHAKYKIIFNKPEVMNYNVTVDPSTNSCDLAKNKSLYVDSKKVVNCIGESRSGPKWRATTLTFKINNKTCSLSFYVTVDKDYSGYHCVSRINGGTDKNQIVNINDCPIVFSKDNKKIKFQSVISNARSKVPKIEGPCYPIDSYPIQINVSQTEG